MTKLTPIHPANAPTKNSTNTKSQSRSASPTSQQVKRNSSNVSLPKVGSKTSFKKNSSNGSLKRDGSTAKLNHPAKVCLRPNSRHGSSQNLPLRGKAQFSVGSDDDDKDDDDDEDDDDDDAWVEASSSQSPSTTRHSPNNSKTLQLEDPPSPDGPAGRTPPVLPHSPPQSPPTNGAKFPKHPPAERLPDLSAQYSHPPDAEIVTHRLLNRHKPHNVPPQMSTISATITPSSSNGSPGFVHVHESTLTSDPSMPADGISRFLHPTGSSSGSATPGSIFQLQSTLAANHHRNLLHRHPLSPSSSSPPVKGTLEASGRAKSAGTLGQPLSGGENQSASPPFTPIPKNTRASPFKSAGEPREAGMSLTQLKLDLQRISTNREPGHPPAVQPPLGGKHGAHVAVNGERSEERRIRQWEQAGLEFRNGRRFNNMVASGVGRLEKRREKTKVLARAEREDTRNTGAERNGAVGRGAGPSGSRGRVRFEVGNREVEEEEDEEDEGGGLQGLLKRMWETKGPEMGE